LATARLIPGIDGGYIFSPILDYFYGVNSATDEIVAYRTDTLDEKFRFPVGQFVGVRTVGSGQMGINSDGTVLYLNVGNGIRIYKIPQPTGQGANAAISGISRYHRAGTVQT